MMSAIRGYHKAGHKVTVLAMNPAGRQVDSKDLPEDIRKMASFYFVPVDTRVNSWDVWAHLIFSKESFHHQRFRSPVFEKVLAQIAEKTPYAFVQLESLGMLHYIPAIRKARKEAVILFRPHRIEHEYWLRLAENQENPVKKYICAETAVRMKRLEEQTMKGGSFDALAPLSGREEGVLKGLGLSKPSFVFPAGADLSLLPAEDYEPEYPSVAWYGPLDWAPNRRGLDWFLAEVWPVLHGRYPELTCYIGGRGVGGGYDSLAAKKVIVTDEPQELFLANKAIFVAPVQHKGDLRALMIRWMAAGRAVVATPLAVEGLGVTHGDQVMIGEDAGRFADSVSILVEQRSMFDTVRAHARNFARGRFNNDQLMARLVEFLEKQMAARSK